MAKRPGRLVGQCSISTQCGVISIESLFRYRADGASRGRAVINVDRDGPVASAGLLKHRA